MGQHLMYELSSEEVAFYNSCGFLHLRKVFSSDEVAFQARELERLMVEWAKETAGWQGPWRTEYMTADEDARSRLTAMHELQNYSEAFMRAVVHERLTGAVADLIGPNVELHHTTLHAKAPHMGTPFPMHQDFPFYEHTGARYVDAILHIDGTNEENGCLKFINGSHIDGPIEHIRGDGTAPHLPTDRYRLEEAVSVPADAGDVVLFSYYTVHGSAPNRTDQWRRLVRFGYRDPDNAQTAGQGYGRDGWMVRGQKRNRSGSNRVKQA
jgi:ectoine hydroxylase-related dioxygenase (phytanoyl-CoA dioxygenase family)